MGEQSLLPTMCAKDNSYPRHSDADPEIPIGNLPKNFPEKTPLSDDGLEAGKREAASPMKSDGLNAAPGNELDDDDDENTQLADAMD